MAAGLGAREEGARRATRSAEEEVSVESWAGNGRLLLSEPCCSQGWWPREKMGWEQVPDGLLG